MKRNKPHIFLDRGYHLWIVRVDKPHTPFTTEALKFAARMNGVRDEY